MRFPLWRHYNDETGKEERTEIHWPEFICMYIHIPRQPWYQLANNHLRSIPRKQLLSPCSWNFDICCIIPVVPQCHVFFFLLPLLLLVRSWNRLEQMIKSASHGLISSYRMWTGKNTETWTEQMGCLHGKKKDPTEETPAPKSRHSDRCEMCARSCEA